MDPAAPARPSPPGALRRLLSLELLDDRYPALHGLRVLAILSVIQFHVTWIFAGEQGIDLDRDFVASSLAVFFGMDLFFVLSGFLIGSILLRSLEDDRSQRLRRFYLRRVLRTFPSYYLVLTFLVLTTSLTATQRAHLPFEYTYLTNFVSLHRSEIVMFWGWSLALEEQFYLTVPLLFFVLHRLRDDRRRVALLLALWLIAPAVRLGIYLTGRPWDDLDLYSALYFRTYTRFDTLVAGLLLALVHRRWGDDLRRWLAAPLHRNLLALPALAALWILLVPTLFGEHNLQLLHVFAWGTITSLMYFLTLILLLHGDSAIGRRLAWPPFRRFATLGYGVYLVHIPICDRLLVPIARRLDEGGLAKAILWPATFVTLVAASLAVAYLLHIFVEKPSLWLRERLGG